MALCFVCDVHIPPRLTVWLRAQEFEATHVFDVGLGNSTDLAIWNYAKDRDAIIVTKDKDFVRMDVSNAGPRLVLVCVGNTSNQLLLDKFSRMLPDILGHFGSGMRVVELR
jgi:predicted nuclease of predicted toxin-antitoxin system